jgi:polar amino acid transport system permease protein
MSSAQINLLIDGAWFTIIIALGGAALGLVFGFAAGLARCSESKALRTIGFLYVELFRGAPVLVLAFWFIYALPALGWRLEAWWAGMLAVGLNIAAYAAEVVRGAIQAVPVGQTEAGIALNMSRAQRNRRVILPQALVSMIPPFSNNLIELLKATAVVSVVAIPELTFSGQLIRTGTGNSAAVFGGLLVGYGVIAVIFTIIMRAVERRSARSVGRQPAPGFWLAIRRRPEAGVSA